MKILIIFLWCYHRNPRDGEDYTDQGRRHTATGTEWFYQPRKQRDKITDLLLGQNPQKVLDYLTKVFTQNIEPVRPDRSFVRKPDQYRTKKKPKMMKNRKINT